MRKVCSSDEPLSTTISKLLNYGLFRNGFQCSFGKPCLSDLTILKIIDIALFQVCTILNPLLEEHFPASSGVRIIAEPGRFYSASAFTLVVNVVARRTVKGSQLKESEKPLEGAGLKDTDELVSGNMKYGRLFLYNN